MDKQKQEIEEMAIQRKLEMTKDISNGIKGVLDYEIQKLAEHLISLNYEKILENAVVLTDKKDIQQFEWSKLVDKMGVIEFGEKIRKETAEKFAERLKASPEIVALIGANAIPIYNSITNKIDEIAKEIMEGKK